MFENVIWLDDVGMSDVEKVGGKNASLGEMISGLSSQGVRVPGGFATTAEAFESFLHHSNLKIKINKLLVSLDITNIKELTKTGALIRQWVEESPFPEDLHKSIVESYQKLTEKYGPSVTFAVRSSATAEDLPEASFAGQQETYLNVSGIDDILSSIKKVFASLYNDRAISYRVHQGFEHEMVSLSAGVQQMVRSDIGASGVMFTLDTESGFDDVVFITSAYGLGETVVQGSVNPDEFYVHKPTLKSGKPAILSRSLGSKSIKMIYSDAKSSSPVTTTEVDAQERLKFSLNDAQIEELAEYAMKIDADGFLKITGRKKEMFKTSGGKYIIPTLIENDLKESNFIEQVMVIGENQKMPAALIQLNFDFINDWIKRKNINIDSTPEAICASDVIKERIQVEVNKSNLHFGKWEQVKKFELTPEVWSIESGHLTPTMKMKRSVIFELYKDLTEKIYSEN